MKEIEWSTESLKDLAALDKVSARRIKGSVERFAEGGYGDIKKLQGINPPEFRLRVGDFHVRFRLTATSFVSFASAVAKTPTLDSATKA